MRLFGDTRHATETSPDTEVTFVIRTVVSLSVTSAYQGATLRMVVRPAVRKYIVETHISDSVKKRRIYAHAFTVLVGRVTKHQIDDDSVEKENGGTLH